MFPEAHRLDHKVAADNARRDPGIVDEAIDYPEPLAYRVHQTVHVFSVDQVRGQISRPLAIPTQNARQACGLIRAYVGQGDLAAGL